jgi:hypothetical protein
VTRQRYSPDIVFEDPITRARNLDEYSFMISLLATVFDNKFEIFDIGVTGTGRITARWSLEMRFRLLPVLPWKPTAVFTGTTEYTIDAVSGLITRHIDRWDAVEENAYLSLEGLRYTLSSFASVRLYLHPRTIITRVLPGDTAELGALSSSLRVSHLGPVFVAAFA